MSMMLSKTYDAFKSAGAPEDKAQAAAEELAAFDLKFNRIGSEFKLVKWMLGVNIAATFAIFAKLYM